MTEFPLTERTTICGRCHHGIAPGNRLAASGPHGHPAVDQPCRTVEGSAAVGRIVPCDCPAVEANDWQEMGEDEARRRIMEHARSRA